MIRENSEYKIRAVSATQLKVLAAGGGYEDKAGCLTRQMADGRLEIVMLRSELDKLERLEREVDLECSQIYEVSGQIEIPELPIVPLPSLPKDDGIPQADKDAWSRMGLDKPPPERSTGLDRPRGNGMGFGAL